ncbi:MAG: nuclear transport factor 2 family protein [Chitinophagales bacterium]
MSASLIEKFYNSFNEKDYRSMQSCYHEEIIFSDPVFQHLAGNEAKAMWHMLVSNSKDLQLSYRDARANNNTGSCHWEAAYTFSGSGRKVLNVIDATFEFRDGKIFRHTDHFDLWKWTRMALGTPGFLLGWSPFLQNKIRKQATTSLSKFIVAHPEYK